MTQTKIYKVFELVYPFQSSAHLIYQEQKYSFNDKGVSLPDLSYTEIKRKVKKTIFKNHKYSNKHIWHLN